jgi:branched-chain amino acid transport system permease protein
MNRVRSYSTPVLLALVLIAVCGLTVAGGDNSITRTVVEMMIRVVLVVALWIFVGNSGVISFGHAGFMAIGAYASAWLTIKPQMKGLLLPGLPDWLASAEWAPVYAMLAAGAFTAVIAFLAGAALLRLTGIAASIGTFAFLAIVYTVYANWENVTGGMSSVVGLPRYPDIWTACAWAILTVLAAAFYANSASGLALRATREDEVAAAASGIDIYRHRLLSLVLSAFFTGVGGGLLGHMIGVLNPDSFYLGITFLTLAMLVIGGISTLTGAVLGTVVLSTLLEVLIRFEAGIKMGASTISLPAGAQEIIIGVIMILCLMTRPLGLSGGKELRVPLAWLPRPRSASQG